MFETAAARRSPAFAGLSDDPDRASKASQYQGAVQAGRNDLASTRKGGEAAGEVAKQGNGGDKLKGQTAKSMEASVGRKEAGLRGERGELNGDEDVDRLLEQKQTKVEDGDTMEVSFGACTLLLVERAPASATHLCEPHYLR